MLRVLPPQRINRWNVEYPASRRPLVAPKPSTVRCIAKMGNIFTPWGEPPHIAVRQAQEHRNLLRDKIATLALDMFNRSILVSSDPLLGAETSSHCEPQQHSPPPTATYRPGLWLIAGRAYDPDTAGMYVRMQCLSQHIYVRIRITNSDDDDDDGYDDDDDSDDDHDDDNGSDGDDADEDDADDDDRRPRYVVMTM